MSKFDPVPVIEDITEFIKGFFESSGGKTAVVGLSGGKDSTIVAALCAKALGKENVIGVILPDHGMRDEDVAELVAAQYCGNSYTYDIGDLAFDIMHGSNDLPFSTAQAVVNLPARLRMVVLYYVAQCHEHGRVANTCNASENYVGYSTWYGDCAGDFSPLHDFTVQEVKAIGHCLGVPEELVEKVPDDGLCGRTDEDNLGFTYEVLDRYIRYGECEDEIVKKRIEDMHKRNLFKCLPIPCAVNRFVSNGAYLE